MQRDPDGVREISGVGGSPGRAAASLIPFCVPGMAENFQVMLLVFLFLFPQKRTSSHGHARKRAKVGALLPLGCSELSPESILINPDQSQSLMLLLSLSCLWKPRVGSGQGFPLLLSHRIKTEIVPSVSQGGQELRQGISHLK